MADFRSVLVMGLYPHTILYLLPLLVRFSGRNYKVRLFLRTLSFSVSDDLYFIDSLRLIKRGENGCEEVCNLQGIVSDISVTKVHKLGLLYLVKYFLRPVRNISHKDKACVRDLHYLKQKDNLWAVHRIAVYVMSAIPGTLHLLQLLENLLPPPSDVVDELQTLQLDLLFVSPANWENRGGYLSPEIDYVKAAKRLRIPSAIYQLSLDNFFSREILHVEPDYLFGWDGTSLTHISRVSHFSGRIRTYAVGSIYFEYRRSHLKHIMAPDFQNEYKILYLGSASGIVDSDKEYDFYLNLVKLIRSNQKDLNIQYRAHPNNPPSSHDLHHGFPDDQTNREIYKQIMTTSIVIGVSTSLMVEAYLCGVQVICNSALGHDYSSDLAMEVLSKSSPIAYNLEEMVRLILDDYHAGREFSREFQTPRDPSDAIIDAFESDFKN